MRLNTVIDLLEMSSSPNENGFPVLEVLSRKQVFASKSSVKRAEFYSAAASGLSLEITFEIYTLEYNNQEYIDFEGKRFKVLRSYEKGKFIELNCQSFK
jgi:SPP1 family predicted phage head-tail adaptor